MLAVPGLRQAGAHRRRRDGAPLPYLPRRLAGAGLDAPDRGTPGTPQDRTRICPGRHLMTARKIAARPPRRTTVTASVPRRMVEMTGAIASLMVREHGPIELLHRLSDPFWFQAFGCVLGF